MGLFDQAAFNRFIMEHNVYGFFDRAVTLKSGRTSHFYANWRAVVEDVFLTERLAAFVLDFVADQQLAVDTFYGVPEGATKLGIIAQLTWAKRQDNYGPGSHCLVMGRAKPKEHGLPRDRYFVGQPRGKVVVLEDVTTTGGSLLVTVEQLRDAEIEISAAISLTNRMEKRDDGQSVEELFRKKGLAYLSMSSALDILPQVYQRLNPGEKIGRAIEEEFARYGVSPLKLV